MMKARIILKPIVVIMLMLLSLASKTSGIDHDGACSIPPVGSDSCATDLDCLANGVKGGDPTTPDKGNAIPTGGPGSGKCLCRSTHPLWKPPNCFVCDNNNCNSPATPPAPMTPAKGGGSEASGAAATVVFQSYVQVLAGMGIVSWGFKYCWDR